MKKLHLSLLGMSAGLVLAFAATSASADGYVRGGVKDARVCCDSWSGFYLGVHGGYGWKENDFGEVVALNPLTTLGDIDSKGSLWGGQAGYNWQKGSIVGGLEIDFSKSNIRGSSAPFVQNLGGGVTTSDTVSDDVKWLGSARARLGFTPGSNFLLYGTAGLAWERVDRIETNLITVPPITQTVVNRDPRDWFGWVVGAGAEAKLAGTGWIGRIEYLHYDFGTVEQTTSVITNQANQSFSDSGGKQTIDVVRAGLSYKF